MNKARYRGMSIRKVYDELKDYKIPEYMEDIINTTLFNHKYISSSTFLRRKLIMIKELSENGVV